MNCPWFLSNFCLWFRLLFNRNATMLEMSKIGKKVVWLCDVDTMHGKALRLYYFNPGSCFWGGSDPVEKTGIFEYRTYVFPGGDASKKVWGDVGPAWVRKNIKETRL